jgi:predicted DsbA family dithiol-disulfide isomerase
MKTLHIEFIGDFICPWCYLGKVRLERLREMLLPDIQLNIEVKPYILYPNIPKGGAPKSAFANKTKPGMGKALNYEAALENVAFHYHLIERIPQSMAAHRLIWLVDDHHLKYQLSKTIFHDYFEKGQDIEDLNYLRQIAQTANIAESILTRLTSTDDGQEAIENYVQSCKEELITVVPYLKINKIIALPGLQSIEIWENYLRRAARLVS